LRPAIPACPGTRAQGRRRRRPDPSRYTGARQLRRTHAIGQETRITSAAELQGGTGSAPHYTV